MEVHGSIYPLTVSADKVPIKLHDAVRKGVRVQGSSTAARRSLHSLFAFVAEHNIHPTLQMFPMSIEGIESAVDVLNSGKMRYRGVLTWE